MDKLGDAVKISIHSLVKRETQICRPVCQLPYNFNPLPRKEGDKRCEEWYDEMQLNFNPLPRKEGDP